MTEDSRNDLRVRVRKLNAATEAMKNHPLPPHVSESLARHTEVSRAFSLGDTSPTEAPRLAAAPAPAKPAPVVADSARTTWSLTKPQRWGGYREPLYRLLAAAHIKGKPRPTAREVLEEWRTNRPAEIIEKVLTDSIDYYDSKGNPKTADLNAIHKVIKRMAGGR